jgi:hypothetical protein
MGWIEDKMAKWARLIDSHSGQGISQEVLAGKEILVEASAEQRAEWTQNAMERLVSFVPDSEACEKIMTNRSCVFIEEFGQEPLLKLREIYHKDGVDGVLQAMSADTYKYEKPYREGNIVYETKNPRYPEEFAQAKTPEEKRKAYCHCPLAGKADTPIIQPYCYCGGGWYVGIWEFITQKPVKVKLVKSVMSGDQCCTFAVHLFEK